MSKSSNDDINITYLDKLSEAVVDLTMTLEKISPNYDANGRLERVISDLAKQVNSDKMSVKQLLREVANTQKNIRSVDYGIEDTTKFGKITNAFLKMLEEKIGDSKIDDVLVKKLATAFQNLDVTAILESEKVGQRGGKGAPLKNVLDNEKLNKVNEDLAKKIGLRLDEASTKLMAFFQEVEEKRTKKTRGFVDDLIDGLGKSKWVGGALQDTFRLIGLLGANWLTQFGQLGRILGGAFYIAMSTAGPLLVNMLLKGVGNLIGKLFAGGIGAKVGWGMINSLPQNGPLGNAVTTFYAGGTGAQKVAAAGRLAGAGLASAGLGAGAIWAGSQSAQSFKQGDKVGGSAFGVGAAGLGIAAIAALVAGITAPVTLIAAAVGGIAVGVGALWKNREAIMEHYKKHKDFYDKVLSVLDIMVPAFGILRRAASWYLDHFGGHTDIPDSYGNTNSPAQKIANALNIQDREQVQTIEGMGINRAGHATNLIKLNPDQASKALKAYYEKYNEQALRAYDWFKPGEFNPNLFPNDASIRDANGTAILVPTYRGHREDFNAYNAALDQVGLSHLQLGGAMQTAGRKSTTHVKGSKHNNVQGLVSDYSPSWSTWDQWKTGMSVLSPMGKDRQFDFYFEGYVDPRMRSQDRRMTRNVEDLDKPEFRAAVYGRHFHVQRQAGYENLGRSGDPLTNIENSKVRAQQQRLDIMDIAKNLEPEVYKDYERRKESFYKGADGEEKAKKYIESQMLQYGYYFDDNTQQWMKKKSGGIFGLGADNREGLIVRDQSGNYKFEAMQTKMENFTDGATNGR